MKRNKDEILQVLIKEHVRINIFFLRGWTKELEKEHIHLAKMIKLRKKQLKNNRVQILGV